MYFKSVSSSFKNSVVSDSATPWTVAYQASLSIGFSRQKYWSGLPFPFQGIFPTQGLNPGLQPCKQMFYHLSHQGSSIKYYEVYFKIVSSYWKLLQLGFFTLAHLCFLFLAINTANYLIIQTLK